MIQIVLDLKGITDTDLEAKLKALAKAQTDHPTAVSSPLAITSAQFTAAAALIEGTITAQTTADAAAVAATKNKTDAVEAGKQIIRDYAPDVLQKTGKDPAKITLLGLTAKDTSAAPAPPPAVVQVPILALTYGPNAGSLIAKAEPLVRLHSIEFEVNLTPNAAPTWQHWLSIPSTPATLAGLPAGALVQVRARGIFANGPGPWSDIAEHRVP